MKEHPAPNIAIKANIWCVADQTDTDAVPYFLQSIIPGDLLVELLGTRDTRTTRRELTTIQHREYEQSRFFQQHGQEGLAFQR